MKQVVDAENDRHHHAETEADVVDETRHLTEILQFMGLRIDEIPDAAY